MRYLFSKLCVRMASHLSKLYGFTMAHHITLRLLTQAGFGFDSNVSNNLLFCSIFSINAKNYRRISVQINFSPFIIVFLSVDSRYDSAPSPIIKTENAELAKTWSATEDKGKTLTVNLTMLRHLLLARCSSC